MLLDGPAGDGIMEVEVVSASGGGGAAGSVMSGDSSSASPLAIERWSCAAVLPISRLLICLTTAVSQLLASLLTLATTSSRVRWSQSRSCAAQTLPRLGGLDSLKVAGRSRVAS